jgi:hypothetical protein
MFFLYKSEIGLIQISCDLHTIKTKVTFRSKNQSSWVSLWIYFFHPRFTFPVGHGSDASKGSYFPIDICLSYSCLHTHTFSFIHSFIHLFIHFFTGSSQVSSIFIFASLPMIFISLILKKSIFKYPQVTSCVQKSSTNKMQKSFKF